MSILDSHYINVQGWMRVKLNLKGNKLLVFALIHGFSQDGESVFSGSQSYIAEWVGTSRSTVNIILKELNESGLIVKIENVKNGVKFCDYKTNTLLENLTPPLLENLTKGTPKIEHHNTINNNKKDNKVLTWRNDFKIYKKQLHEEYTILINDLDFIKQQEKFYYNVDIKLSLKKACVNFWATEAGWEFKKRKRIKDINWKATLTNSIDKNKVYSGPQNQNNYTPSKKPRDLENYGRVINDK